MIWLTFLLATAQGELHRTKEMTGIEWLRRCESRTPPTCDAGVRGFYTALYVQGDDRVCAKVRLDKAEDFESMARTVVAYIRRHPELHSKPHGVALFTALTVTHPCPSR